MKDMSLCVYFLLNVFHERENLRKKNTYPYKHFELSFRKVSYAICSSNTKIITVYNMLYTI